MEKNIQILSKKCRNKKVIFYCISDIFDEISSKFNLDELFDIDSLCDIRFKNEQYKNYTSITPDKLKERDFDYLIIVSPNFSPKEKYLKENNLINKKTKILNFFQKKIKIDTQKNYKNIIKKLKSKEKIKALFCCEQNEKWSYTKLYQTLKNNSRFEVLPVVLFPITSKGQIIFTQSENKIFFEKLGIKTLDGWDYENNKILNIQSLNPDIIFYQQPWYLNNINHPKNVSNYALTIMAPYGYTTLSPKEWGSDGVKEIYRDLWLFMAESPYHVKFYKKAAKMRNNLAPFGSLKFDNYKESSIQNSAKPKIIYAPHHTISTDGLRMSTFQNNYKDFLNFAKENQQFDFVFKPHPMLINTVVEYGLMTRVEYQNYLNEWKNLPNSEVCLDGDYFEIFKTSNLMITDCSSFLAEYFPTKNPIIFLNRLDRAPFDDFGNKIKKGFYFANDFKDVENHIKNLFEAKIDPLAKTREEILNKHFYLDEKLTCNKVVEFLIKHL